ncbi:preprotein translocase subunit SecG [Fretibacter rubidus]|uniref:preprotein translocase subunit SecG n=1 Tax=Fretibacter rubidus TaxID=570162 RepID=UPI00352B307A
MANVLLVIQLLLSIVLTGLILIQRSEGGALGIGGGGGGGGFMSGRSATNSISKMTGIIGALFIINAMALSVVFNKENQSISQIDDSNAVEALTIDTETPDNTNPLADETVTAPNPVNTDDDATPDASQSESEQKPKPENE